MEFVAFVGKDKENWGQVTALLNRLEYNKAVIVKSIKEDFPANEKCRIVEINPDKSLIDMKEQIRDKLKPLLSGDFEVSLSLASGNGKEHMALLSALLNIPVGVKIVVFTKEGIQWLS
ncbi:hypothetical protein HYZ97_00135 [Candidatus Pacearchaeota archaeon]|nr:hypothetical protein [Candidatus Pacearchaeota archaeon]